MKIFCQMRSRTVNLIMTKSAATDPDDNCFLECAEAAGADYLITGNKRHFLARWKNSKIVNTREFLDTLVDRGEA